MSLTYWDSSALMNAVGSDKVAARFDAGEHCTRLHALVEVFHHLSGRGIPTRDGRVKVTPGQAAAAVRDLVKGLSIKDLTTEQTLVALDDAQSRGVSGRMVHDWLHVRAAKAAGVAVLLTRDPGLEALSDKERIPTDWP